MTKQNWVPARVVEFETPKRVLLRGLWFGSKRSRRVVVFVHGLGGSAFSMRQVIERLDRSGIAVLSFNNRGHDVISSIRSTRRHARRRLGGAAHEIFTECVDDIEGALRFARRQGARELYLMGHSTGCQKSVYWAGKRGRGVRGIVLLAPVSDYAAELHRRGAKKIGRVTKVARALLARGKKHSLLPEGLWHETLDAQRFLSLYTPGSIETIFPYEQERNVPRLLKRIHVPLFVLWAEEDEYAHRPAKEIAAWFEKRLQKGKVVIIPRVKHSFRGGEKTMEREIRRFMER
ncbi:alpha/beta fold hydrolase [Candidatus Kaiserbacteria bacterium]|nr:alpha/beta fold hydrolase [Candidatus Kaiserbacteria bacterium]